MTSPIANASGPVPSAIRVPNWNEPSFWPSSGTMSPTVVAITKAAGTGPRRLVPHADHRRRARPQRARAPIAIAGGVRPAAVAVARRHGAHGGSGQDPAAGRLLTQASPGGA